MGGWGQPQTTLYDWEGAIGCAAFCGLTACSSITRTTRSEGACTRSAERRTARSATAFELIEDADPVVAGYFVALLYPVASDAFLHDICDGIAMSIAMQHSATLAPILRDLASNEGDDDIAKRYREWAENIEAS